jgi:hypothetical protein
LRGAIAGVRFREGHGPAVVTTPPLDRWAEDEALLELARPARELPDVRTPTRHGVDWGG